MYQITIQDQYVYFQDRLLDFKDIDKALNDSSHISHGLDESTTMLMRPPVNDTGLRFRKYNSKTGGFEDKKCFDSSDDEKSDDEKEHETVIRFRNKFTSNISKKKFYHISC